MDLIISATVWIAVVFLIALLFPVSLAVWFLSWPFDPERKIFHRWMLLHGRLFAAVIPFWKIKIEGREKADRKGVYVIICNHQSLLDILVMNCLRLDFRWISKIENTKLPVIGWYLRMAKYHTVDRNDRESKDALIEEAAESLRRGFSIMIFPEGTRSKTGEPGPYKLGAFRLALMTDKPILPVVVEGTGGILPKHGMVFSRGHMIRIRVLDPVYPGSFGTGNPEELAERFRDLTVRELDRIRKETADGL